MKIFEKKFARNEYITNQISRSDDKFEYCKVRYQDVLNWYNIIKKININNISNICCMGSRNGREIDLFRIIFNQYLISKLTYFTEIRKNGWNNLLNLTLNYKRSKIGKTTKDVNVFGVEINPKATREDTYIGSFDELPNQWHDYFDIIYSNSFDQSMDPYKTANEWKKVIKKNGLLIFSFSHMKEPTESDPVGNLSYNDVIELFQGEVIYFDKYGSNYSDLIIRLK